MRDRIIKAGTAINRLGDAVVVTLGLIFGAAMTYYSFFYTEICVKREDVYETCLDSAGRNLLVFAAAVSVLGLLGWLLGCREGLQPAIEKGLLCAALCYGTTAGLVWVGICHVVPYADASAVCTVAESMCEGKYAMLPPTYMSFNPQQYGLVFVLHRLFSWFGKGNYSAFQYMNVLMLPLLIYAGYRILKIVFDNSVICIFYFILLMGFVPLFLYLPYVYGDFGSAACGMVLMWQTLSFCRTRKPAAAAGGTLAAAFGCLLRMNTVIVVIAAVIVLIIHSVRTAKLRGMAMALALVLAAWGPGAGVKAYYRHISGLETGEGIPAICYIMMGLENSEAGPGWFSGSNYTVFIENNYDHDAASEAGMERTRIHIRDLWRDKRAAVDFFRAKLLTQWNAPDYYSLRETKFFDCGEEELPAVVRSVYFGEGREILLNYMNRYQAVLFISFLILMICSLRGRRPVEERILLVAVVGGLLFSLLWEAMSRYVLPYVVYMIPLAAAGIYRFHEILQEGYKRLGSISGRLKK